VLASPGTDPAILAIAQKMKVPVEIADPAVISRVVPREAVHQGLAVHVYPLEEQDVAGVLETAKRPCCLILLDQVTDPHNFGAVIRSAAAFGASAIIVQDRHSPPLSGVLAKAASGALEKMLRTTSGLPCSWNCRTDDSDGHSVVDAAHRMLHTLSGMAWPG
jgi:23S rRNA (guanosine2251-2'-O)-methyltransferase